MSDRAASNDVAQLNHDLLEALLLVNDGLRQSIATLMRDLSLTEPVADALWQLEPSVPLSRRELARRLRCDPSNVTFLVDRLEEKGLAARADHPQDRRVKAVTLTPAGLRARKKLIDGAANSRIVLGLTTPEKEQLLRLLTASLGDNEEG